MFQGVEESVSQLKQMFALARIAIVSFFYYFYRYCFILLLFFFVSVFIFKIIINSIIYSIGYFMNHYCKSGVINLSEKFRVKVSNIAHRILNGYRNRRKYYFKMAS